MFDVIYIRIKLDSYLLIIVRLYYLGDYLHCIWRSYLYICFVHFVFFVCFFCNVGLVCVLFVCFFFFFKQNTAYELRISDWSSDVCSSDLFPRATSSSESRWRSSAARRSSASSPSPASADGRTSNST